MRDGLELSNCPSLGSSNIISLGALTLSTENVLGVFQNGYLTHTLTKMGEYFCGGRGVITVST